MTSAWYRPIHWTWAGFDNIKTNGDGVSSSMEMTVLRCKTVTFLSMRVINSYHLQLLTFKKNKSVLNLLFRQLLLSDEFAIPHFHGLMTYFSKADHSIFLRRRCFGIAGWIYRTLQSITIDAWPVFSLIIIYSRGVKPTGHFKCFIGLKQIYQELPKL